jgi:hypothetical protein
MDAIIGRYRVHMEETQLVLIHRAGISFDLTRDEALAFADFTHVSQQTLTTLEYDTDPSLEQIVLDKGENRNK